MGCLTARGADVPDITGQYWFDRSGERHTFTPGSFEISTDGLEDGLHTIHAYVDNGGSVSSTHTGWFLKRQDLKQGDEVTGVFYVDGREFTTQSLKLGANGMLNVDLDITQVDLGVHTIGVTVTSPDGLPMGYRNGVFLRVPTDLQMSTFGGYYFLDGQFMGSIDTQAMNGVYHLDIDASSLTSGLHNVTVYLASPHGMASSPQTAWFVKIPEGGEGVKHYSWWVNDDKASLHNEVLPEVANPFSLISLIDVPVQPFRSKSYAFAIENQQPVFYASNNLTVQFSDPDGRVSTGSRTYTDVRTRKPAEDVSDLAIGSTSCEIPANAIKLYRFDAEMGDSLGVRLDRAAMLDLYDPEAGTLFKVSGADATKLRTFTARKNGTYYLAVHDPTNGNSVNIGFAHIHKFALLEQSVTRSANRGAFEMKVTGNGFDSLESLALAVNDAEYEIQQYRVLDNYTLYVMVDLDEHPMPLGEYRLKGKFKDSDSEETILSSSVLTVEEPTPVDIEVEVKPSFKIGTPYLVYVNVTNHSNVGCWGIPFNFAAKNASDGSKIDFMDFEVTMDEEFKDYMPVYHETEDLLNTGEAGAFMPAVIPFLAPGETKTLTLGLTTAPHEVVTMYAWAGKPWSEEAREMLAADQESRTFAEPFEGNLFTFEELCKLYYQLDSEGCLDYSESTLPELQESPAMAPARSGGKRTVKVTYQVAKAGVFQSGYSVGHTGTYYSGQGISLFGNTTPPGLTWTNFTFKQGFFKYNPLGFANQMFALGFDRVKISFNKKGGEDMANARGDWQKVPCLPVSPIPSNVEGFQSGDPNDMSGYVSPAGTHHIGKGVKNVTYTIEFENDPEIASAPAARIKVNSTVDGKKLDLSTMRALKLTLGDKEIELPAGHHFVKTLDMRTEINAIAELTFDFDDKTGEARWSLRSLDPLTLEEITYMGDGILPVNDDSGRGTGYLTFSVDLLPDLKDAETIESQAVIIFDDNEPIATPVWTNETDFTLPTSSIVSQETEDNLTFNFTVKGKDTGSGIWIYDLYMRNAATGKWTAVKTEITGDTFSYTAPETLEGAEFAVLATDKAGNRQDDAWLDVMIGDSDNNGVVDSNDAVAIVSHYTGSKVGINQINADVTGEGTIDTQDATAITNLYLLNSKDKTIKKARIR